MNEAAQYASIMAQSWLWGIQIAVKKSEKIFSYNQGAKKNYTFTFYTIIIALYVIYFLKIISNYSFALCNNSKDGINESFCFPWISNWCRLSPNIKWNKSLICPYTRELSHFSSSLCPPFSILVFYKIVLPNTPPK